MSYKLEVVDDTPFRLVERGVVRGVRVERITARQTGFILGCHYHKVRKENYVVYSGSMVVYSCQVDTSGRPVSDEIQIRRMLSGEKIRIPLLCAHGLSVDKGTVLICVSDVDEEDRHMMEWFTTRIKELTRE